MDNIIDRIGERRLMNCGEYATIIRYGSADDVDVRFDSGEIVQSKRYYNFSIGSIAKPRPNRLGERRLMNCGEYATIIRYENSRDIDVKFDTGEVVKNRTYESFIKGQVKNLAGLCKRLGEKRLMNCGEYATIIRYGDASDIDIQFDSGAIVRNRNYGDFKRGRIKCPLNKRLGERRLMNCGEYATIIRYGNAQDIDVKFDKGEIVYNKMYKNFLNGKISKLKYSRLGERRLMNCGEYATIIRYGGWYDIDVQFDSGVIVRNRVYFDFKIGGIAKPLQDRVGERHLMNCGEYATIIRYVSAVDIDVKFDSGEIDHNKSYNSFIKGSCSPYWYNRCTMRTCYYDKILNDVIILMKDGSIKRKSELLGGIE